MKGKLLACSGFMLAAAPSVAQTNVTLYGVVDSGVEYANHQVAGGNLVRLNSGNVAGPRWGLRGTEELGSGLKAVFLLENGFDPDTGRSAQGGRLFGRSAYVGLNGAWGRVTFGRQQNLIFDMIGKFDPMLLAPKYSITVQDGAFVGRADNTAKYIGMFGGLTASAMYSFGSDSGIADGSEVPGNSKIGREYGLQLSYSGGSFAVGAVYDEINTGTVTTNPDATTRRVVAAGTYSWNSLQAFLGYRWARAYDGAALAGAPRGTENQGSSLWWTGLIWQIKQPISLGLAAYYQNFKNTSADPWLFVAMAKYAFSKRTDAYMTVGYTRNKGSSNLGLSSTGLGFGATRPGTNQLGAVIGIRHTF